MHQGPLFIHLNEASSISIQSIDIMEFKRHWGLINVLGMIFMHTVIQTKPLDQTLSHACKCSQISHPS